MLLNRVIVITVLSFLYSSIASAGIFNIKPEVRVVTHNISHSIHDAGKMPVVQFVYTPNRGTYIKLGFKTSKECIARKVVVTIDDREFYEDLMCQPWDNWTSSISLSKSHKYVLDAFLKKKKVTISSDPTGKMEFSAVGFTKSWRKMTSTDDVSYEALSLVMNNWNDDDGNELLRLLKSTGSMRAYASGLVSAFSGIGLLLPKGGFCPPSGVTHGQTIDIVKSYLEENPKIRHKPSGVLINQALKDAYPCK